MDGGIDRGDGELLTCQLMSCAGALISHVLQWMQLIGVGQLLLHEINTRKKERMYDKREIDGIPGGNGGKKQTKKRIDFEQTYFCALI